MSLSVKTSDPEGLLKSICQAIDKETITTWIYDKDGNFIHSTGQWANMGWLEPVIKQNSLKLFIRYTKGNNRHTDTYAMLFGAFTYTLLKHFDDKFETATTTAQPDK